jgi:hypothetical protein
MPEEIWKPISGFEGRYEVSNLGRVRSLTDNKGNRRIKVRSLRMAKNGYLYLNLWVKGKMYVRKPHRLVAEAFLDRPEGAQCVNHINGDKTDNRAENLEWCTYSQNTRHAIETGLITDPARNFDMTGKHGKEHPTSKPVEQYDLDGNFIAEYESGVEAANALGFRASNIQRCAAGRRKTAHGYKWKYKGVEWRYEHDGRS